VSATTSKAGQGVGLGTTAHASETEQLSIFARAANATARAAGKPASFGLCVLIVIAWAVSGPVFRYSDTWQLVINTGTTIITFLMVFLIQNSQNRDSVAVQIKLDELIRATAAHNGLLAVEDLDEDALERVREQYRSLARHRSGQGKDGKPARAKPAQAPTDADEACVEVEEIDRELTNHEAEKKAASTETAPEGKNAAPP
jgi:low affinity Fe/Cu permease